MKIINTVIFLLLLSSNILFGQTDTKNIASAEGESVTRAKEIIKKSREAISKEVKTSDIKGLTLSLESKLPAIDRFETSTSDAELSVSFPDKIYSHGMGYTSQNSSVSSTILNGEAYDKKFSVNSGGKSSRVSVNFGTKEDQIRDFKWRTWTIIFPITLDSWYFPLEFKFLAIAESKDGKAEVIEAVSSNNVAYRLFFDQKSHLLLLMTVNFKTAENKQIEDKYFFSDYREDNGLIIAHKIDVQQNGETTESRTIKNLIINPEFKPDFFDVTKK